MYPPILVVLYEPTEVSLRRLSDLGTKARLFLFDNSRKLNLINIESAIYIHSNKNVGITGAIKWMFEQCKTHHYERFIFFDQDTQFSSQTIESIAIHVGEMKHEVGLVHFTSEAKLMGNVKFIINSGSLFIIKTLELCQDVLERYFVDAVDLAICFRIRQNNLSIMCCYAPDIDHISEQGFIKKNIIGITFSAKKYSTIRRKEFYNAHKNLIIDCIKERSIVDAVKVSQFLLSFFFAQLKCDMLLSYDKQ